MLAFGPTHVSFGSWTKESAMLNNQSGTEYTMIMELPRRIRAGTEERGEKS